MADSKLTGLTALTATTEDDIFYVPAMPIPDVIDPTGAGDTFAGGLIGYVASQPEVTFDVLKTAIVYGSATASYCVEDFSNDKLKSISKEELFSKISDY